MADMTIKEIEELAEFLDELKHMSLPSDEEERGSFDEETSRAASALRQLLNAQKWRPIDELPSGKTVFIFFRNTVGKGRIVKAKYAKKYEIEQDPNDAEFADYNEEEDKYYWPEGWYEDVYAETGLDYSYHHMGDIQPTHFMSLPAEPTSE